MIKALVIAEHDAKSLSSATRSTIAAAQQLAENVSVLLAGVDLENLTQEASKLSGVQEVIVAQHEAYAHLLAENMAQLCAELVRTRSVIASAAKQSSIEPGLLRDARNDGDYQYILASANTFGKNLMPRIAGLLDVDMVSEVIQIIDAHTFVRPIYAGNAQETVEIQANPICLTIRPTAFEPVSSGTQNANIQACDKIYDLKLSRFVKLTQEKSLRPELTSAKIVVSGGRALGSQENFKLIEKLADVLGGAIGATRAAVDAGYIANEYQVGQTGKVVAPDLYFAIGISGAIQHIAGMKDSKVIVAINKDSSAPIFQIADYGLVADLFQAVPELTQKLEGK